MMQANQFWNHPGIHLQPSPQLVPVRFSDFNKNKREYPSVALKDALFARARQCGKTSTFDDAIKNGKIMISTPHGGSSDYLNSWKDAVQRKIDEQKFGVDIYCQPKTDAKKIKINFKIEEEKEMTFKLNKDNKLWGVEIAHQYVRFSNGEDEKLIDFQKDIIQKEFSRIKELGASINGKNIDINKRIEKNFDIVLANLYSDYKYHKTNVADENTKNKFYHMCKCIVIRRDIINYLKEDKYNNKWISEEITATNIQNFSTVIYKNGKRRITVGRGRINLYVGDVKYSANVIYRDGKFLITS